MNVEIGAEAALFPEKEYISGISVAVCSTLCQSRPSLYARVHIIPQFRDLDLVGI
jgi:hypothetical protein